MPRIVDLSVPLERTTTLPPPVTRSMSFETLNYPGPGWLQATWLTIYTHAAAHVDSPLHVVKGEITIDKVDLEKVIGEAVILDLTDVGPDQPITPKELDKFKGDVRPGDIVLLRTDWSDKTWGTPDYWHKSPYLSGDGSKWIANMKPRAVGFDFFEERCARFKDFKPEDFVAHLPLLGNGIIIIEGIMGLGKLTKKRVQFFAAPVKWAFAEAAPARIFAIE